jgi:hypothetical protein
MTGFSGGRRFSCDPPDRPFELPYAEPADSRRQREYPARPTASLARCGVAQLGRRRMACEPSPQRCSGPSRSMAACRLSSRSMVRHASFKLTSS